MKRTDLLKLLDTIEQYVGKSEASFDLRKHIQAWDDPPEGPGGSVVALDDPPEGPGGE